MFFTGCSMHKQLFLWQRWGLEQSWSFGETIHQAVHLYELGWRKGSRTNYGQFITQFSIFEHSMKLCKQKHKDKACKSKHTVWKNRLMFQHKFSYLIVDICTHVVTVDCQAEHGSSRYHPICLILFCFWIVCSRHELFINIISKIVCMIQYI
jgi:hypothetical protein